ncbi:hypothetical protein D6774_02295, partial [Candidatus Woesearchaeota archaeon]
SGSSNFFEGNIDDIQIFDRALTPQQIQALYNNRTDLIVSTETSVGDVWEACVTPNDGFADGSKVCSNNITILPDVNTAPTKPVLLTPTDGNTSLINRTQVFNWTASTDNEGDPISYQLNLTSDLCPQRTFITTDTNYTISGLNTTDECGVHYWSVTASDGSLTNTSETFNFSIEPTIILSFVSNVVDFGDMMPGEVNDTEDDNPLPFIIENSGNVKADILNISASNALFTSVAFPSSYWQFKADNSTEVNSFNWTGSLTSWVDISASNQTIIRGLKYETSNNSAQIDIRVEVPSSELPALRQSTLTIVGAQT